MDPSAKISIEHLTYKYDDGTESLTDVTLSIAANQITALFGPAGGGKSTLLRVLNRLNDLVEVKKMTGRVLLLLDTCHAGAPGIRLFVTGRQRICEHVGSRACQDEPNNDRRDPEPTDRPARHPQHRWSCGRRCRHRHWFDPLP